MVKQQPGAREVEPRELRLAVEVLNNLLMNHQPGQLPETLQADPGFVALYDNLAATQEHLLAISRGDLRESIVQKGFVAGCLRSLQANLRHLTWQTKMIAAGDFSQRVDYLGEFSTAFNAMTEALAQARADLAESEARYRLLAEHAADVIVTLDQEGRLTYVSPSVTRLLGYEPDKLVGRPLREIASYKGDLVPDSVREMVLTALDGSSRAVEMSLAVLPDGKGVSQGLIGVVRDITERKQLQEDLLRMATVDGLTGALNRRHFLEVGVQELARVGRQRCPVSVLQLDIDHFKEINDAWGHQAGDVVLRLVVEIGRQSLRAVDAFGRVGGDEFAVLLPATSGPDAMSVAERLRKAYEQERVPLKGGGEVTFTVSVGVAECPFAGISFEELLHHADAALYEAKNAGRNCVRIFTPPV